MAETKRQILVALSDNLHLIPSHMVDGTLAYISHGREVGGFLTALFQKDFERAKAVADPVNLGNWSNWMAFMEKGMPSKSYGTSLKVACWQKMGGLGGYPDDDGK